MSVIKINAISVPEGMGPELEKRFAARAGKVDEAPGFEEFMLLRPIKGEERYFVLTRWESEEAFQSWLQSRSFREQHKGSSAGEEGAPARPPVASGADLLEFEVVASSRKS